MLISHTSAFLLGAFAAIVVCVAVELWCGSVSVDHADAVLRERGIAAITNETARQMRIAETSLHAAWPSVAKQVRTVRDVAPSAVPVLTATATATQTATGDAPCLVRPGDRLTLKLALEEIRAPTTTALVGEAVMIGPAGELLRQPINAHNTTLHSATLPQERRAPGWAAGVVGSLDSDLTPRVGALVATPGACVWRVCLRGVAALQVRPGLWDRPSIMVGSLGEVVD